MFSETFSTGYPKGLQPAKVPTLYHSSSLPWLLVAAPIPFSHWYLTVNGPGPSSIQDMVTPYTQPCCSLGLQNACFSLLGTEQAHYSVFWHHSGGISCLPMSGSLSSFHKRLKTDLRSPRLCIATLSHPTYLFYVVRADT